MSTPVQAMLWELWRTSRAELLLRIGGLSGLVVLIGLWADFSQPEIQVIRGIVVMLLTLTSVLSFTWLSEFDSRQSGFSFRLGFARPVSTAKLVVVPMLFTVGAAVICFLVPALMFRGLLDGSFPLAGPAAGVACVIACCVACAWSASTRVGKAIALLLLASMFATALVTFHARHADADPFLMAMGKPHYFDLSWYHYAACLAATAVAAVITIAAVERQRHGDGWRTVGSVGWPALRLPLSRRLRPFSRPAAAQCWYEMRCFGNTVLLLSIAAAVLVFFAIVIVQRLKPNLDEAPQVWLFAIAGCPLVYQLIGSEGAIGLVRVQGATRLSAFDAVRPMPSDALIAIKMLMIAACSLFGCLVMAGAAALHASVAEDGKAWTRIGEALSRLFGDVPAHWWAAGVCDAALLYISTTAVFLAFGLWLPLHHKLLAWGVAALYLHMALAAWDASHQWRLRGLWTVYGYVVAAAILIGCILALSRAHKAGFLGRPLFLGALCLWVVHVGSMIAVVRQAQSAATIPTVLLALGGSLLLVPLASTAFAPLALAAHRHA